MKAIIDLLKDPDVRHAALELVEVTGEIVNSIINLTSKPEHGDFIDYCVPYGHQKKNGSHNHTYNKGEDRTPAQKAADMGRRRP